MDGQVSFYERGAGHATFFTEDGVVLSLSKRESKTDKPYFDEDILGLEKEGPSKATGESVYLSFVGTNKKARISSNKKMTGKVNYFIGNDRSKWRSNIPTYGAVPYKDVYKNIDVKYYGNNKNIEHDVIVRPGGGPSLVKFAYEGVKGLKVTEEGDLEVSLIYQEIDGECVDVDVSYRLINGEDGSFSYGFKVASYDHTKDLIIDPVLVYSIYLGGSEWEHGIDIAVDSTGAAYITGPTLSTDFPLLNPIQGISGGGGDAFITKINPKGTALVYSTYMGGNSRDVGDGIAVDSAGAAYVTGYTQSTDFPLMNPIYVTCGDLVFSCSKAFVTKINSSGSAIIYSTYLWKGGLESDPDIAVDSTGSVYVIGTTGALDIPLVNPIQGILGGFQDAIIMMLNPTGTAIVYSTYLGGSEIDYDSAIAVDGFDAAYVTGRTSMYTTDSPVVNPLQGAYGGGEYDAFVTKIAPAGTAFVYPGSIRKCNTWSCWPLAGTLGGYGKKI